MPDTLTFTVRVTRTTSLMRETVAAQLAKTLQATLEELGYLDVEVTSDAARIAEPVPVSQPCS